MKLIGWWQAYGLAVLGAMLSGAVALSTGRHPPKDTQDQVARSIAGSILVPLISLGCAWIAHGLMR